MDRTTLHDIEARHEGRTVLSIPALRIEAGERRIVFGPSGSGKTTLLRLIAGLQAPQRGTISRGEVAWTRAGRVDVPPEARRVGLVFQGLALWPTMSVEETLIFAGRGRASERRAKALDLATRFELGGRLKARPEQLSGGERQRLALARALISEPEILLLDEPFGALDVPLKRRIFRELEAALPEPAPALVLVTHLPDEALAFGERITVLDAGRALFDGPLLEAWQRPASARVAALLDLGALVPAQVLDDGRAATELGAIALVEAAAPGARGLILLRPENIEARLDSLEDSGKNRVLGLAGLDGHGAVMLISQGSQTLRVISPTPLPRGLAVALTLMGRGRFFPEHP